MFNKGRLARTPIACGHKMDLVDLAMSSVGQMATNDTVNTERIGGRYGRLGIRIQKARFAAGRFLVGLAVNGKADLSAYYLSPFAEKDSQGNKRFSEGAEQANAWCDEIIGIAVHHQ